MKIRKGDTVLRRSEKKLLPKEEPYYDPKPYKVVKVKSSMVTVSRSDKLVTRNISFFKKLNQYHSSFTSNEASSEQPKVRARRQQYLTTVTLLPDPLPAITITGNESCTIGQLDRTQPSSQDQRDHPGADQLDQQAII